MEVVEQELAERVSSEQSIVVQQLAKDEAQARQFYRFLNNDRVSIEELIMKNCEVEERNQVGRHILAIGDSSSINLGKRQGRIKDIESAGVLNDGKTPGFHLHVHLGVDAQSKNVLGLTDVIYWTRSATAENIKAVKKEEKESYRWFQGAENVKEVLSAAFLITYVYDREADDFALFHKISREIKEEFVIRSKHDRTVRIGGKELKLSAYLAKMKAVGTYEVELDALDHYSWTSGKRVKRAARKATIELRYGSVEVMVPKKIGKGEPMVLTVVQAKEVTENLPQGESPLNWVLWTTHKVEDEKQARQIVEYYLTRWRIEQLFRAIKKKGLAIESTELETFEAILRQTTIALKAACRVSQLVYARNKMDAQPIQEVFDEEEQLVLEKVNERVQGRTEKQKNPFPKEQLSWATWIIARLGGWKGYQSQRPPGPRTIKIGLEKFNAYMSAFEIFNST